MVNILSASHMLFILRVVVFLYYQLSFIAGLDQGLSMPPYMPQSKDLSLHDCILFI